MLLHCVVRLNDIVNQETFRVDLIAPENFIQCSSLNLEKGHTFKPHKHKYRNRTWDILPEESWHVIRGKVKCIFYDTDDKIIAEPILYSGDTSFTLAQAGHNYLILEENTLVLEYKVPRYEGQEIDKMFI